MKRFVAALALLAVITGVATADCGRVRCVNRVVVAEVVTPVVATVATFVPVTVAAYSASYQPQPQTDPAVIELVRQLRADITDLRAQVSGGAVVVGSVPNAKATAPQMPRADVAPLDPGAARFVANCSRCHDAGVSAAKGKGITLFQGGAPLALTCEQALACTGQIAAGTMPKSGQLERDEDGPEILVWLAKQGKK